MPGAVRVEQVRGLEQHARERDRPVEAHEVLRPGHDDVAHRRATGARGLDEAALVEPEVVEPSVHEPHRRGRAREAPERVRRPDGLEDRGHRVEREASGREVRTSRGRHGPVDHPPVEALPRVRRRLDTARGAQPRAAQR
ncbi:hypothetical protein Slu03_10660 [Sediminihabitans luteus]|nr:hypothetical protein Slu03_10660 [Sediminihabitans luteus]